MGKMVKSYPIKISEGVQKLEVPSDSAIIGVSSRKFSFEVLVLCDTSSEGRTKEKTLELVDTGGMMSDGITRQYIGSIPVRQEFCWGTKEIHVFERIV